MKNKLKLLLALLTGHTVMEAYTDHEIDSILKVIAEVETGGNDLAVGDSGERSRYQFKSLTWYMHTDACFITESAYPNVSKQVAIAHLNYLIKNLNKRKIRPTVFRLAVCWNKGLEGGIKVHYSTYANRIVNLFEAMNNQK